MEGLENRIIKLEELTDHLHDEIRRLKLHLTDAANQWNSHTNLEHSGSPSGTKPASQAQRLEK